MNIVICTTGDTSATELAHAAALSAFQGQCKVAFEPVGKQTHQNAFKRLRSMGRTKDGIIIKSDAILINPPDSSLLRRVGVINPGFSDQPDDSVWFFSKATLRKSGAWETAISRAHFEGYGDGCHLHKFDPNVPLDYDFDRYVQLTKTVSFRDVPPQFGLRKAAVAELLRFKESGGVANFARFCTPEIVRRSTPNLHSGERLEPIRNREFGVEALVTVVSHGYERDLHRLIPTAQKFAPKIPLHIVCDAAAKAEVGEICKRLRTRNVTCHEWINEDSLDRATSKLNHLVNQANYWKPGPIWFKLEAMRRLLAETKKACLLVDCDIIFTNPLTNRFEGVDLVMSPFFWPNPMLTVPAVPGSTRIVPISERDGWYNAGYLLATRPEIAEAWLDLYESGVGGFYEQYCMGWLPQHFHHTIFGTEHNFGQWRAEAPKPQTVSCHAHIWTTPSKPHELRLQRFADKAVESTGYKIPDYAYSDPNSDL